MDFSSPQTVRRYMPNASISPVPPRYYCMITVVCSSYFAVFVAGWRYSFPTSIEQWLWRGASFVPIASIIILFLSQQHLFGNGIIRWLWQPSVRLERLPRVHVFGNSTLFRMFHTSTNLRSPTPAMRRADLSIYYHPKLETAATRYPPATLRAQRKGHWYQRLAACIRNNSISQDPQLTIRISAILPTYVLGVLYCFSRAYVWTYDLVELRSLPASAYQTVDWNSWLPHLGV